MKKITAFFAMCLFTLGMFAQPAATPTGTFEFPVTAADLNGIAWNTSNAKIVNNYYLNVGADEGVAVFNVYNIGQTTTKPDWWATNGSGSGTAVIWDAVEGTDFQGGAYYESDGRYWTARDDRVVAIRFTGVHKLSAIGYANAATKYLIANLYKYTDGVLGDAPIATRQVTEKAYTVFSFGDVEGEELDENAEYVIEFTSNTNANSRICEVAFYFTPEAVADDNANIATIGIPEGYSISPAVSADVTDYVVTYPYGSTVVPDITATAENVALTPVITPAADLAGTTTIVITAADGEHSKTYNVTFAAAAASADNFLSHVEFNNGFDAFIVSGDEANTITAYYMDGADVPVLLESSIAHNGVDYTVTSDAVTIIAENGDSRVYTISLTPVIPFDGTAATFDGTETYVKTGYTYDGTKGWRTQQASKEEYQTKGTTRMYFFVGEATKVIFTQGTQNRNIVLSDNGVEVFRGMSTGGNGGTQEFALDATAANHMIEIKQTASGGDFGVKDMQLVLTGSDDATLSDLTVEGVTIDGFAPDVVEYDYEIVAGVITIPEVAGVANDVNAQGVAVELPADIPGDAVITVTAENGVQKVYTIHFLLVQPGSGDATLSDLTVDGVTVEGFAAEVYDYNVVLPAETLIVPEVLGIANDANAQGVEVSVLAELPGDVTVTVTAENGAQKVYTIHFSLAAGPDDLELITETTLFNFGDMSSLAGDITEDTYFSAAHTLLLKAGPAADNKHFTLQSSSKTIDGITFPYRLKTNGVSTDDARLIKFRVAGHAKITVYAISSSSSEDRPVQLLADGAVVETWTVLGSAPASYTYVKTSDDEVEYTVKASENAINYYGVKVFIGDDPADEVISETTFINFSNLDAATLSETMYYEKVGLVASSSKTWVIEDNEKQYGAIAFTKRVKSGGSGSSAGRYMTFNVAGPCKIEVIAMSSNSTARNLEVKLNSYNDAAAETLTGFAGELTMKVYEYTGEGQARIFLNPKDAMNFYGLVVLFGDDPDPTSLAQAQAEGIRYIGGVLYNDNNYRLEVFSVTGQKVADTRSNLDMRNLQSGMYLVRFNNQVLKLVK